MEIILTEDVPKLGNAGDVVKVKEGYGRNFLLPQKKGLIANSKNMNVLAAQKKMIEAKVAKVRGTAEELKAKIEDLSLSISVEVGEGDRLFGSVTNKDIAEALQKNGVTLDRHLIVLESPIKTLGEFDVTVKLNPEVSATIKFEVVKKDS